MRKLTAELKTMSVCEMSLTSDSHSGHFPGPPAPLPPPPDPPLPPPSLNHRTPSYRVGTWKK